MNRLLQVFEDEGCRMVEMSCEEHDRQAASSQFITHTVGRMLGTMVGIHRRGTHRRRRRGG